MTDWNAMTDEDFRREWLTLAQVDDCSDISGGETSIGVAPAQEPGRSRGGLPGVRGGPGGAAHWCVCPPLQ